MRLLLVPTAAGFDYRASGGSKLGPFTSNGRILLPQTAPTTISIAALDAGGAHASGDLASDPGGFTGRLTLANGTLGGTLDFAPAGEAQRIDAHLVANGREFPGRLRGAQRPRRRHDHPRRRAHHGRRRRSTRAASTPAASRSPGSPPMPSWSTAAARSARPSPAGAAPPSLSRRWPTSRPTRSASPAAAGSSASRWCSNQAAVLTRSGDGWALAPTNLSFAGGKATVSGRSGSRPEVHAQVMAMPLEVLDLAWPGIGPVGLGDRPARLCVEGQPQRPPRSQGPRAQPRRARSRLEADRCRASRRSSAATRRRLRAVAASGGAVIGRAQARFAPMGNGPLVAELMNAPMFAQLRYAGPADTLWRLSGTEVIDLSGPLALGADIGGRLADPVIRGSLQDPERAAGKRGHRHGDRPMSPAQARFAGPQLIFSQIAGATPGGGSVTGNGSVTFSGGKTAAQPVVQRRPGAAAQPRRRCRAGHRPAADPLGRPRAGTISGDLKLDKGRFQLGRASAAAAVPQLEVSEQRARSRGRDRGRGSPSVEARPRRSPGSDLHVTGLGINSRWTTNLQDRRVGRCAALHRPRRSRPRRL